MVLKTKVPGHQESCKEKQKQAMQIIPMKQTFLPIRWPLRSIIGCPGGMSTFCLYFRALFGCYGEKDRCTMFGCNNDRLFSSLVLEIWSFTVYFSGKRRSLLHPNMAQGSFFPLQSYSKKTLRKNVLKSVRKYKRNVLMPSGHLIILLKSN